MAENENDVKKEKAEDKCDTPNKTTYSFGSSDPSDGRKKLEWESRYPKEALKIIRIEATTLAILLTVTIILIFLIWCGAISNLIQDCCENANISTLKQYSYFALSGLLGGTIFSIKYLYHAVARGTWHIDRQLWRFLTPLMSLGVAFIVGALVHADLLGDPHPSAAASISIGFIAGYFSDNAIAKMYEIANVFFGTNK
ncbi:MAG: hypothetical protein OEY66_02375 [Gammaproteobacteria bacterium]|nr:hypothetical protein [Gammaproteobacteria bacterium]